MRNLGRRSRVSGFVSLFFVLVLLFPVVSANDDLAQFELINDAKTSQSIVVDLKSHIQISILHWYWHLWLWPLRDRPFLHFVRAD